MMKSFSSEEKLLNLIRKGDRAKKVSDDAGQDEAGKESKAQEKSSRPRQQQKPALLKTLNIFMIIVCVVGVLILCYRYFMVLNDKIDISSVDNIEIGEDSILVGFQGILDSKPTSYYQKIISGRDIFKSPWDQASQKKSLEMQGTNGNISMLEGKYQLLGVIVDDAPQAIFLDLQSKETIFVRKGQRLDGAVLEVVEEGRAIFKSKGKRQEFNF